MALAGFILMVGVVAVDVGALAGARAAAQTAANGAELVRCDCTAVQAVVRVTRRVRLVPGGLTVLVTARARAVLGRPPP
jgi:UDP-N-acetylmuramyl tripeptide synthase